MLRNMTIAPKLGILVGATLLGLCVTGGIASYLMQQEMFNARVDQEKAIVSMAKNMAGELKRQVDAGEMTKDQAMAMLRKLGNAMTYDNGSGYIFATTYDGITQHVARSQAGRHQPHGRCDQRPKAFPGVDGRDARQGRNAAALRVRQARPGNSRSAR